MKIKSLFLLGMILVGILALSGIASALSISEPEVKLDGNVLNEISDGSNFIEALDKGDSLEVQVRFEATEAMKDVQVEANLRGYDHDDLIEDISNVFSTQANRTYTKKLTLTFPKRMDQDVYSLNIIISDRQDSALFKYELGIETGRHDVAIKDVDLSPSNGVKAGRALLATVRLQNYGAGDENDVKVTFSIPELGVSASDYIDELKADGKTDDQKSTEELYLRIPSCVEAGIYDADVEVRYHDGDEVTKKTMSIEVLADETCEVAPIGGASTEGKTVISVGPESQDVAKGAGGVIYPVTITNGASTAKTFVISVTGGDWGTFRVSPSNVVTVAGDETKSVYVYASANDDAPVGEQVFGVEIMSGDKTLKEVTLKANVTGGSAVGTTSLKRALEIGLIVLVVILVILGLIIGFNKLKGDDEDKEEGQSYY